MAGSPVGGAWIDPDRAAVPGIRPRCGVALLARALPPADRAVLVAAVADRSVSAPALAKALRADGLVIGAGAIKAHRRDECRCPTSLKVTHV